MTCVAVLCTDAILQDLTHVRRKAGPVHVWPSNLQKQHVIKRVGPEERPPSERPILATLAGQVLR